MAKMLINDSTLTAIADAIRAKMKSTGTMLPGEMAGLINGIAADLIVAYGDFTPTGTNKTKSIHIAGASGSYRQYFLWLFTTVGGSSTGNIIKDVKIQKTSGGTTSTTRYVDSSNLPYTATDVSFTLSSGGTLTCNGDYYFRPGEEYRYAFVGME